MSIRVKRLGLGLAATATLATACDATEAGPQETPGAFDATMEPDPAPGGATTCRLWQTPMIETLDTAYVEDCASLPAPRSFECGEYWMWLGLRERFDERLAIIDRLGAILQTPAAGAPENAEWAARMHAYRGMLSMAAMLENGEQTLAPEILPSFEAARTLAPQNDNLPLWPDTMEIAFAWLSGDHARMTAAADRAFERVDACGFVNLITLGGTTIGLPLNTGYPQRTIELLDAYRCEGVDFCTRNTWRAPYARPGLSYQLAEAYARVGNRERARTYLEDALTAPGADTWAYRPMVQATLDELDLVLAEYEALGQDKGAFLSAFSNTRNGCIFCHAPSPPLENVPTGRLPIVPDPDPHAPSGGETDAGQAPPEGVPVSVDDPAVQALLGRWIQEVHDARHTTTPIGEQVLESTSWGLVTYSIVDGELRSETRACHVELGKTAGLTLSIPDAVLQGRPSLRVPVEAWRAAPDGPLTLVAAEACDALGYTPVGDPRSDDVPVRADDPRVLDVDADGNPGLTVTLAAEGVAYHMYVARRACSALRVTIGAEGHTATGHDLATNGAQRVLGADSPVFANDLPSWPSPDPETHRARLRRAPDGTDCGTDLAALMSDAP
jgi:hypothetical protein